MQPLETMIQEYCQLAMENHGSQVRATEALGIDRQTLRNHLRAREFRIKRDAERREVDDAD